jgi:hypothetical protein
MTYRSKKTYYYNETLIFIKGKTYKCVNQRVNRPMEFLSEDSGAFPEYRIFYLQSGYPDGDYYLYNFMKSIFKYGK